MTYFDWVCEQDDRLGRLAEVPETGELQLSAAGLLLRTADLNRTTATHVLVIVGAIGFGVLGPIGLAERMAQGTGIPDEVMGRLLMRVNRCADIRAPNEALLDRVDLQALRDGMIYLRDVYEIESEFQTVTGYEMEEFAAALSWLQQMIDAICVAPR